MYAMYVVIRVKKGTCSSMPIAVELRGQGGQRKWDRESGKIKRVDGTEEYCSTVKY